MSEPVTLQPSDASTKTRPRRVGNVGTAPKTEIAETPRIETAEAPKTETAALNLPIRRWLKPSKLHTYLPLQRSSMVDITDVWQGPKETGLYLDQTNNLCVYVDPTGTVLCVDFVSAKKDKDRLKQPTYVSEVMVDPPWIIPDGIKEEKRAKGESTKDVDGGITDNPKGMVHLRLGGGEQLLHNTNMPWLIGKDNGDELAGNPKARYSHGCGRFLASDIWVLAHVIPKKCAVKPYVMDKDQLSAIYAQSKDNNGAGALAAKEFAASIHDRELVRAGQIKEQKIASARDMRDMQIRNVSYRPSSNVQTRRTAEQNVTLRETNRTRPSTKTRRSTERNASVTLNNRARLGKKGSYKQTVRQAEREIGTRAKQKRATKAGKKSTPRTEVAERQRTAHSERRPRGASR